jgi:transcriptional regulator with XRE-family HTH domain
MSIKDRIKECCTIKGITLKEMQKELVLGNSYMQQAINPRADKLKLIADYLDISIDYLLGRTDDMYSHKK